MRGRSTVARFAAPAAFLLAATVAILIVRAGLSDDATAPTQPTTVATTTAEEPNGTTTAAATTTDASGAEFYVIEAGDTLAVVADQFDTTVEQLLVLNPDVDPVALTIGQRIRVK
jgi:LysM repeat protein